MVNLYSIINDFWYSFLFLGIIIFCNSSNVNGQGSFESPFTLAITFDQWPEESSWDIRLGDTTIVHSADYQSLNDDSDNATIIISNLDILPANGYFFNFYDAFIDGICCIQGNGSFTFSDKNGVVVIHGGEFEVKESIIFNVAGNLCSNGLKDNGEQGVDCGGLCVPCNEGCKDKMAHNFDPDASLEDGSCLTCDDGVKNGDEVAIDCGGLLCEPCEEGCIDLNAHNYNPTAKFSDGSCETCSDGILNGDEILTDCGGLKCEPCESNCPEDNYNTISEITSNMSVFVNESIQSNHKIHSNLTIEFSAGHEIVLEAGFEVDTSTVFRAVIGRCLE